MSSLLIPALVLVVVGGVIAYLGDWLGLNMGKRRLSVLGLRPRSTARLFTVVAGALIAGLTLGALLAVDHGLQVALQRAPALLLRNHALTRQNRSLQYQAARADQLTARAQAAAAAAQAATAQAQLDARAARADQSRARAQLGGVNAQLHQEHAALAQAARQVALARGKLRATASVLAADSAQYAQLRRRSGLLAASNARAERSLHGLVTAARIHKEQRLIYDSLAEVGRTDPPIPSDQPVAKIRFELQRFLEVLSAEALQRGAARGANTHAVQLAPLRIGVSLRNRPKEINPAQPVATLGASAILDTLAQSIHALGAGDGQNDSTVVVIARAAGNAYAGEPVSVSLTPYYNRLALRQGQVLGRLTLPAGDQGDRIRILADLQGMLVRQVRPAAIAAGVIPVDNPEEGGAQVGDVPLGDVLSVVDQVRRYHNQPVTVTARAAADTYSAGPVVLVFSVAAG